MSPFGAIRRMPCYAHAAGIANEIMIGAAVFFAGTLVVLAVLFIAARCHVWRAVRLPDFFALARAREAILQVATLPPWRSWCARGADAGQPRHVAALSRNHRQRRRRGLASAPHRRDRRGDRMRAAASYFDPGHRRARGHLGRSRPAVGAAAFAACATDYALYFLLTGLLGIAARTAFDHKQLRRPS